jgi:hypothetical protein
VRFVSSFIVNGFVGKAPDETLMSVGLLSYADTGQQKNRFTRRGRILKGESSHKRAPRTKQYPKWIDSARYEPFDKPHGSVIGVPETSGPSGRCLLRLDKLGGSLWNRGFDKESFGNAEQECRGGL